jgi:hypothetical protein
MTKSLKKNVESKKEKEKREREFFFIGGVKLK